MIISEEYIITECEPAEFVEKLSTWDILDPEDMLTEYLVDEIQEDVEKYEALLSAGNYKVLTDFDGLNPLVSVSLKAVPLQAVLPRSRQVAIYDSLVSSLAKSEREALSQYEQEQHQRELDEYTRLYLKFEGKKPEQVM